MTRPEVGTIISGTLRDEDLLDAFTSELKMLLQQEQKTLRLKTPLGIASSDWTNIIAHKQLVFEAQHVLCYINLDTDHEIAESVIVSEIINELQDAISEYAPDGMYFGTLEGDGADFGWWYIESKE